MKVLVLSEHYHPRIAGTVTHVDHLTRSLCDSDLHVVLAVPALSPPGLPCREEDSGGRLIVHVPVGDEASSDAQRRQNYIERCRLEMPSWLSLYRPDLVHVMYGHYVYAALAGVAIPKIWTCHNVPPQEYHLPWSEGNWRGRALNSLYAAAVGFKHRRLIRAYPYDRIISVSEITARLLRERVGVSDAKIVVVANGVRAISSFAPETMPVDGRFRILTVGGMKKHKGIHHVGVVGRRLLDAGIDFEWHLVGPHSNRQYVADVQRQIAAQGLSDRIIWEGALSAESLDEQYRNANVYVHMASQEGFCLTVLEALATGVPVVGTRVGAIPEMIARGSGVVVEPQAEGIASGLLELIRNYRQLRKGRELGLDIQRHYSWGSIASLTQQVYADFIRR